MEEELTKTMHSEFTISKEDDVKLKAGCVWDILKFETPTHEEILDRCKSYNISYEDAIKWRDFWVSLQ